MKPFRKVLLIAGIISLASCSKDKEETPITVTQPTPQSKVQGLWRVESLQKLNGKSSELGKPFSFTITGRDFVGDIEFKSDLTSVSGFGYNYDRTKIDHKSKVTKNSGYLTIFRITGKYKVVSETKLETNALREGYRTFDVSNLTDSTMTLKTSIVQGSGIDAISYDLVVGLKK